MAVPATTRGARGSGGGRRMSLRAAFSLAIGGLLVVGLGAVLAVTLVGAGANTRALLSDKANLMLETAVSQIRSELDPAAATASFIADRMAEGAIDVGDRAAVQAALETAHAGLDQAAGIIFIRPDGSAIGVRKLATGGLATGEFDMVTPELADFMQMVVSRPHLPLWGAPSWSDELQTSVLNVVRGVVVDGELVGTVGVAVSVQQFSEFLGSLAESLGQNAFALIGRDTVLAHPSLAQAGNGLTRETPLPPLAGFSDPVLAQIWDREIPDSLEIIDFRPGAAGHAMELDGETYIFVYQNLAGYADRLITVGAYFTDEEIGGEVERLIQMAMTGVAIVVVAMLLALVVAGKLARPFGRVAAAANRVGAMALEDIEDLPASRIREIDDQARAFNGMVRALRWLEIYVPRRLAQRLLAATGGTVSSQDAEVTVMFTDIVGFTRWSEAREAPEVADFLNRHFAVIGQGIEATGGTIDKFIGDGAMAFWGAPERQDDHVLRAVRAACLIAEAMTAETGDAALPMRIGIHCGRVTVGNIGAPDRMNYTIVGDPVNVCQRLEQAGRDITVDDLRAAAVVVVVSEAVAQRLPTADRSALRPIGAIALRGRAEPIDAYRLDWPALCPVV